MRVYDSGRSAAGGECPARGKGPGEVPSGIFRRVPRSFAPGRAGNEIVRRPVGYWLSCEACGHSHDSPSAGLSCQHGSSRAVVRTHAEHHDRAPDADDHPAGQHNPAKAHDHASGQHNPAEGHDDASGQYHASEGHDDASEGNDDASGEHDLAEDHDHLANIAGLDVDKSRSGSPVNAERRLIPVWRKRHGDTWLGVRQSVHPFGI